MFYFDVIFKTNLPVTPLNVNSDKMIFSISVENQTFIRYVAADGTSMILHSFDYRADFVNASLSFDFRLLSLTELINENGNKYYSSRIYDIQNPMIKSSPIISKSIIKGDIEGISQYSIIYLIHGKISQYFISFQEDNCITLSKDRIKYKTKQIIWSHYSPYKDILSVLSRNGEKYHYYCNYINNDIFFNITSINEQSLDEKDFYSANFQNYYSLLQHYRQEDSDQDQLHAYFLPQNKHLIIDIPKVPNEARLNCIQYNSVVFAFVPNIYIRVIDIKEMKIITLDCTFAIMPISVNITVYDEGIICDNQEGVVYSTRIDLSCLKNLANENEIQAAAIISARIMCLNYFYIPKEKIAKANSESVKNPTIEPRSNSINNENKVKVEKMIHLDELTRSSSFDSSKKEISKIKIHSDSEGDSIKNNSSRNFFIDSNSYTSSNNSNNNNNNNNSLNINQTKSDTLMSSENFQKNNSFKKSFSFDKSMHQDNFQFFENLSIEYQRMYGKIIVDKLIVSNIFDFLIFPLQITSFIKEFIKLNGQGCSYHPIPALSVYCRKPHHLSMRIPLEIKSEISQIDQYFPTTGLLNRFEIFSHLVKTLIEDKSVLSLNEAHKKAIELIREQNTLVLNLKDSLLMWQVQGKAYKFRKFLVTFCLYSELSFMNLPQISGIRNLIIKFSRKFFSKTIREMMTAFGIYGSDLCDLKDKKDLLYWRNRINVNIYEKRKPPSGQKQKDKQKDKKLIQTFTVPYFKIRNQKVFRVHHYSHIP